MSRKVFASWRRVRTVGNPVGYARTVLLNTFLSHSRLKRSSELPAEIEADDVTALGPDIVARLDILDALATLPGIGRAVVVLRYWEDRSVADTATDLGITEASVRTKSSRALARLRPLLTESARS